MSQEEQKSLLVEFRKLIMGGAITIAIGVFAGAIVVRDSVIQHEIRISSLEKSVDRHEILLTEKK
jgi:hypothetical protein